MAIPERRTVPRGTDGSFGQPGNEINIGDLGPGSGGGLFPKEPVKRLPDGWMPHPIPVPVTGPGGDRKVPPLPRVIRGPGDIEKLLPHPIPRQDPGKGPAKEWPLEDGTILRPGVQPVPDYPTDGSGNKPVSGRPMFDVPGLGKAYPFPGYVTNPNEGAIAQPPEFNPGFGPTPVSNMQDLIDQIAAAMANNQITGEAAQALIATVEAYKPAVQNMGALASADVEAFAGDGSNQFAVQETYPGAGTDNALRPVGPDTGSVLQPDEVSEEDSGGDLYKTLAGPRGYHESPHGTKWDDPPDYDMKSWSGTEWQDDLPFFNDGKYHKLSSRYGWRYLDEDDPKNFHSAIDVTADAHTPVRNATKGVIAHIYKGKNGLYGVVIKGDDGYFYTYYHMNAGADLKKDQKVDVGTPLGTIEDQGRKSHLHHSKHDPESGIWSDIDDSNSVNPL